MRVDQWQRVERVLDTAFESDPASWHALVEESCGSDAELRREVEALLARYVTGDRFLDSPPSAIAAALVAEATATDVGNEGRRIGPYRIVRLLGQGGMARVYLAERADGAFTQHVAVKLLKPGLDSEIDHQRFRAERQILASLNHPNIARLFDGGLTDDGLPYLVLEYVDGLPIDRFCGDRHLSVRERLQLFLTAANATQFAHRNLIVHRDLKPSNVFVTTDGQVKLLDFGLAKLLQADAAPSDAVATRTGHRWMTPEYAAPEQIRNQPVTTLTDVYQLGAMLYHLLAGRTPFAVRIGGSLHDLEASILGDEPTAPSSIVPALRGDIDAIVLKALRKNPDDRYASVQAFADDITRHVSGHAVQARRASVPYRVRRFVQRHWWGIATATVIVALLATYAISVTVQRERTQRALAQATIGAQKAEQVSDFMLRLFEASEGGKAFSDTLTARALLQRGLARARELTGQPEVRAQMLDVVGQIHVQLGDYDQARQVFGDGLAIRRGVLGEEHVDVAASLANVGDALFRAGSFTAAVPVYRQALAVQRRALSDTHATTLETIYGLANALHSSGDAAGSTAYFDEWMRVVLAMPRELRAARADQLVRLGQILLVHGDLAASERAFREALNTRRAIYGDRHPSVADALHRLGTVLRSAGNVDASEPVLREAVELLRATHRDGPPELAIAVRSLAITLQRQRRFDEAQALYRDVLAMYRRFHGPDHVFVGNALEDLGGVARQRGDYVAAEPILREAIRVYRASLGADNLLVVRAQLALGDALLGRGSLGEAEPLLLAGFAAFKDRRMPGALGEGPRRRAIEALVKLYETQGRESEAARYRALTAR